MLLTFLWSSPVPAARHSGNSLLKLCTETADLYPFVQYSMCIGYIQGVLDHDQVRADGEKTGKPFCVPNDVSNDQLRKVAINNLNEYPENLHLNAASLVATALHEAFPCE
jgi:hypothetical protein